MANCKIINGLSYTCADKKDQVGGFKQTFWIGNNGDLDKTLFIKGVQYDVAGYITNLSFVPTTGLIQFDVPKSTLTANTSITRTEGGYSIYPSSVSFSTVDVTPAQRAAIEALANADDLFAILETTSGRFEVLGLSFGLTLGDSNERDYGKTSADNSIQMISLNSEGETAKPKIFFDTDYATTAATILGLVN